MRRLDQKTRSRKKATELAILKKGLHPTAAIGLMYSRNHFSLTHSGQHSNLENSKIRPRLKCSAVEHVFEKSDSCGKEDTGMPASLEQRLVAFHRIMV